MTEVMSATERTARQILAANGEPNPHPALLTDTIREVEYHGRQPEPESLPDLPVYSVEREDHEVPCIHPMCHVFHKNREPEHLVTRVEWVILEDGERKGWAGTVDAFERQSDALAYIAKHAPQSRAW